MPQARILILEDDASLLTLYSRILIKAGHAVFPALTLSTARELLAREDFDVFISDIGIGEGRSLDLLRQEFARLQSKQTEIVVVSGREEARYMCEEMGIDFFLHKPVSGPELRTLIERLTQRRRTIVA
jgi:DNA-binding response OmpR family regulator